MGTTVTEAILKVPSGQGPTMQAVSRVLSPRPILLNQTGPAVQALWADVNAVKGMRC